MATRNPANRTNWGRLVVEIPLFTSFYTSKRWLFGTSELRIKRNVPLWISLWVLTWQSWHESFESARTESIYQINTLWQTWHGTSKNKGLETECSSSIGWFLVSSCSFSGCKPPNVVFHVAKYANPKVPKPSIVSTTLSQRYMGKQGEETHTED